MLALQEVLPHQRDQLERALPDYRFVGHGRQHDHSGEQCTIGYAPGYELEEWGVQWLSETPSRCSVGWDACLPRVFTWARFVAPRPLLFINAHFDHLGSQARLHSGEQILDFIQTSELPAVVAGDLNALPDSAPLTRLLEGLDDATSDAPGTFHDFGREAAPYRIDYLLHSRDLRVTQSWVERDASLSDHYPVLADFEITAGQMR